MIELLEIATRLTNAAAAYEAALPRAALDALLAAANNLGKAWSGSNLGYHSRVYYRDFRTPPPGAHFSPEWGLDDAFGMGTKGDWIEVSYDEVLAHIERDWPHARTEAHEKAKPLADLIDAAKAECESILELENAGGADELLKGLGSKITRCKCHSAREFFTASLPGNIASRDALAVHQGMARAPHQEILFDIAAIYSPSKEAKILADLIKRVASHITRRQRDRRREALIGTNVFIGHGRSQVWRDLKDFLSDRLGLPYDEFNRVPVAGLTNITRLHEMLNDAAFDNFAPRAVEVDGLAGLHGLEALALDDLVALRDVRVDGTVDGRRVQV